MYLTFPSVTAAHLPRDPKRWQRNQRGPKQMPWLEVRQ